MSLSANSTQARPSRPREAPVRRGGDNAAGGGFFPASAPLTANRRHVAFDPYMELLCSLPRSAPGALIADLAEDFGMRTQWQMNDALKKLRRMGHRVIGKNVRADGAQRGQRSAWAPDVLSTLQARAYWKKVYGTTA